MAGPLERFAAARLWLSLRIPFLGAILHGLRPRLARPEDGVETAGVAQDGTLVLCAAFCDTLSEPHFRFVVAHEALHPALRFWARRGPRDPVLFNAAHDYAINLVLSDFADRTSGFSPPPRILLSERYRNMSAEQIYDLLVQRREAERIPGMLGADCRSDLSETPEGRAAEAGDGGAGTALADAWSRRLQEAIRQHAGSLPAPADGQGEAPGEWQFLLGIDAEPARVEWHDELRRWIGERAVTTDLSYRRPSRRAESADEVLASVVRNGAPHITILWDTSGSMRGDAAMVFRELREIVDVLGLSVRLIACDAAIQADVESIDSAEEAVLHLRGWGGSDFRPGFDRLDEEGARTLVLAFTDGYISVPDAPPPALIDTVWVLTARGQPPTRWGHVLRMAPNGGA